MTRPARKRPLWAAELAFDLTLTCAAALLLAVAANEAWLWLFR